MLAAFHTVTVSVSVAWRALTQDPVLARNVFLKKFFQSLVQCCATLFPPEALEDSRSPQIFPQKEKGTFLRVS